MEANAHSQICNQLISHVFNFVHTDRRNSTLHFNECKLIFCLKITFMSDDEKYFIQPRYTSLNMTILIALTLKH